MGGLGQLVEQRGRSCEPNPTPLAAGDHAQAGCEMCLSGASVADQQDRLGSALVT
jgi:hypothetical protein